MIYSASTRTLITLSAIIILALTGVWMVAAAPGSAQARHSSRSAPPGAGATATATALAPSCDPAWSIIPHPTGSPITDVSIVSANEMWAVDSPNVLRYVTGTWSVHNVAPVIPFAVSISGLASDNVWTAGGDLIAHWDGTSWARSEYPTATAVPQPTPYNDTLFFKTIKARSPSDVWAAGGYSGNYGSSCVSWKICNAAVAHYDGTSWGIIAAPDFSAPKDPQVLKGQPDGATLHFAHYDDIAYSAPNETWFIGSNDSWGGQVFASTPMSLHCTGTSCVFVSPVSAGTRTYLGAISGTSTNNIWAVGFVGTSTTTSLIEHWNGGAWTIVGHPNVGSLSDVTAITPNDVWAVGPSAVLHYDGTSWQQVAAPAGADAIDSRGSNNVWAAGSAVMHYPDLPRFSDVDSDNTFYRYIQDLACMGIISGYADGTFLPGNPVTRGQLSKIVANAAGFIEPVSGQTFEDVPPNSTFYEHIERLFTRGIIQGYACGGPGEPCIGPENRPYFRPNAGTTRGQISKIVTIAAGFTEPIIGQTFEDVPPGSTFYEYVERLATRGYIQGYACGGSGEPCGPGNRPYFRPGAGATRGQLSKIVYNALVQDQP